jgi:hypothetical protein
MLPAQTAQPLLPAVLTAGLLACWAFLASVAAAQLPFRDLVESPSNDPDYGVDGAGGGDVDGDGHLDFAVAQTSTGAVQPAGEVYVYSGASGSLLYVLTGQDDADGYGLALASLGDIDGDSVPDLVIGAREDDPNGTGSGRVEVVSGADGSLIHELTGPTSLDHFGDTVCAMGNMDGDGVPDFAVAEQGNAKVFLFSGADASVLLTINKPGGPGSTVTFPDSIASAGDVDGDGVSDLLAGSRSVSPGGGAPSNTGAIWLISGATGSVIRFVTGDDSQEHLGAWVAGGVDLDGDSVPDFLGGAPLGSVTLFSGATDDVIAKHEGLDQGPAHFGEQVEFVGDANGDGVTDYAGISRYLGTVGSSGYVQVFSGADHSLLDEFQTPSVNTDHFGSCFAVVGDTNADGFPEFVVGAKGFREAHVMTLAGALRYGELAEAAQTLSIGWESEGLPDPTIGRVVASGAPADAPGLLLLSPARDTFPYSEDTTLLVDLFTPGWAVYAAPFDAAGTTTTLPGSLRYAPADGLSFHVQFAAMDAAAPAGWATSPGLEIRFTD